MVNPASNTLLNVKYWIIKKQLLNKYDALCSNVGLDLGLIQYKKIITGILPRGFINVGFFF
ncbi:hypothetical protein PTE01_05930 [Pseudoalteromonas tetraodonis GFC]|uniref:Uncharacterized protein n=1 Tax=Pseudoalteromonas tetraodonis GFC TaxID=1315271 RepID=A0AA37S166_9GAMM|nr:hypothetical protein PTE01_05930 [Pseudoalteromonas tetraodonis GFC]GLQ01556.1 hypothetical protein GCM10007914_04370 [Pseudoalteromonas tetraodonis GFC]